MGQLKLPNDVAYPSGKTFATGAKTALEEIARTVGGKSSGDLASNIPVPRTGLSGWVYVLTADTGLLDSPEPVTLSRKAGTRHIPCFSIGSLLMMVEIRSKNR